MKQEKTEQVKEQGKEVVKHYTHHTKEQREFNDYIKNDYYQLFLSKYFDLFINIANTYTIESRIDEETWKKVKGFIEDSLTYIEPHDEFYSLNRIKSVKYPKEMTALQAVREQQRFSLIKKFLEYYEEAKLIETKTAIQQWNKEKAMVAPIWRLFQHMYFYFSEFDKK